MIKVIVPASTANLGSGFDCLGAALSLYNEMTVTVRGQGLKVTITEGDSPSLPKDERNLFCSVLQSTLKHLGKSFPGLEITMANRIPLTGGLGSSSACIVGGILAANALAGYPMQLEEMIARAAEIEGHPDNVLPCFMGGISIGCLDGGRVYFNSLPCPDWLGFIAITASFPLATKKARGVLPKNVPMHAAVYNLSRAALFVSTLFTGKTENITIAIKDALHQPYRKHLIPDWNTIEQKAMELGALGFCLSGAGSTLMALTRSEDSAALAESLNQFFSEKKLQWNALPLTIAQGAKVIEE